MKYSFIKKFIIVIIWIFILNLFIMFFYGFFFADDLQKLKDAVFFRIKYYSREVFDISLNYNDIKSNKNNVILKNNISVKIADIDYEQTSGKLRLNFDFSTNDDQNLENISFMLRVHDSENIFYNDIIGNAPLVDNIDNLIYTQNLYNKLDTKGLKFVKTRKNVNGDFDYIDSEKNKNIELNLDLDDNYKISNNLIIKILDIIYQPLGDFSYKVIEPLGEFKFTIKF